MSLEGGSPSESTGKSTLGKMAGLLKGRSLQVRLEKETEERIEAERKISELQRNINSLSKSVSYLLLLLCLTTEVHF